MTVAAIYVRRTELGIPVEDQLTACRKAIREKGWDFGHIYSDQETSNGAPGVAYISCLGDMRRRKMGAVVAHSAERMFRDLSSISDVLMAARAGNVTLHLCLEGIATAGVHGAYLVQAANLVTRIVTARQSEVRSHGMLKRKARGLRVGRPPRRTPELDAHIEELLDAGVSQAQIERDLKVTRFKVRTVHRAIMNNKETTCSS